jgi:hypothetical protein
MEKRKNPRKNTISLERIKTIKSKISERKGRRNKISSLNEIGFYKNPELDHE